MQIKATFNRNNKECFIVKFIQNYIMNRELKKFNIQEELRLEKERIRIYNDSKIQKMKEDNVLKEKQTKCKHRYVEIGKNRRTVVHVFNLREQYYVYDLICTKCHLEKLNVSEEYRNYTLNKSKIMNYDN